MPTKLIQVSPSCGNLSSLLLVFMIILCCAMTVEQYRLSCTHGRQTMLAHIVTIVRIRQSQTPNDGRNGAVDDTVLSKITTKRSFTVL